MHPGAKKSLVFLRKLYSLQPIIFFANIDISKYILVMNTSVLVKRKLYIGGSIRLMQNRSTRPNLAAPSLAPTNGYGYPLGMDMGRALYPWDINMSRILYSSTIWVYGYCIAPHTCPLPILVFYI
jgi:hypothetical protein